MSSQPEVYNTSFGDVISVKISQEAVITYSFLANATVNDDSPFNHTMSLTISAGSHLLVSLNLVTWECFWNSLDCALLLSKSSKCVYNYFMWHESIPVRFDNSNLISIYSHWRENFEEDLWKCCMFENYCSLKCSSNSKRRSHQIWKSIEWKLKKNHIILFSQIKEDCKIYYISPISEQVILRFISFQIDIRSEIQNSARHCCNIVTLNV